MAKPLGRKALFTLAEIMDYLQCGKGQFKTWVGYGLPTKKVCGRWISHVDALDSFFLQVSMGKLQLIKRVEISDEDIEENGH